MNLVVFEDQYVDQLYPVTTGRAAYAISCGSYRLVDWLAHLGQRSIAVTRPHLETLQYHDFPNVQNELDLQFSWTLLINSRLVPALSNLQSVIRFRDLALSQFQSELGAGKWIVATNGAEVEAALIETSRLLKLGGIEQWSAQIDQLPIPAEEHIHFHDSRMRLFRYPHDIVRENMEVIGENLEHRIASGKYQQFEHGVFMGQGVNFGHHVVFDPTNGPIVVDDQASLGPFSLLRGPVYLGCNARLSEYASIKDYVSISDHSKIGGEVESTVIEAYTNKQHHGFLGHSYVGSWVNLGAGTCNSDLKNTYGKVNAEYRGRKVSTEMQFFGCVIGDYAKTAINTSIFTGKIVGNASMVYGFATTNVPSFVNYARTFNEMGKLPPEVIVATQARMFARRNVTQRPCDIQLIHDMFRLTEFERPQELADTPLML